MPHVWVFDAAGRKHSTFDLCGHRHFTLLTGIGGQAWADAAVGAGAARGLDIKVRVIGPRQAFDDHSGDWARMSEIADAGCLLVRPDHHVAWRSADMVTNPLAGLDRALRQILGT